ncbi:MFS transporter [bacterium]|nr:MFS transporter [bacterium]
MPARRATRGRSLPVGYFLSPAGMDGGFFLIMAAMPFKVLALGGGSVALGTIAAVGAASYIVAAPTIGRLSDRVPRRLLSTAGAFSLVACAVAAWLVPWLEVLIGLQVLMGLGKALYWPPVQATIGDRTPPADQGVVLGRFNLAWSTGKSLGFVVGGLLLSTAGFQATYLTGAGCVIAAALTLPRERGPQTGAPGDEPTGPATAPLPAAPAQPAALLAMSWLANTAAYGSFGILTYHLPQFFEHRGWQADLYGWYLGAILGSQTLLFWVLGRLNRVRWTEARLWVPQLGHLAALVILPWLGGFAGLILTAPLVGLGCGVAYQASITASLQNPATRGQRAGIHEGLIGAGGFLPPLIAGVLVDRGLGLAAPYWFAAALVTVAIAGQVVLHRRARRNPADRP